MLHFGIYNMTQNLVNKNRQKLDKSYKLLENVVKVEKNNTFLHEIIKCVICKFLKNHNYCFITEARFINLLRADVYDLENDICYEIVHTESEKSIEKKKKTYLCREIIVIYCYEYADLTLFEIEKAIYDKIKKYL
jgi:hypothetical protein